MISIQGEDKKAPTFDEFANCLSIINTVDNDDIRCDLHDLYFSEDYVLHSFKKTFGTGLNLPKVKATVHGNIHFASKPEMFDENVFCFYDLLEITAKKKTMSFKLIRHIGKKDTEFLLIFSKSNNRWFYDTYEIILIEERDSISPGIKY